ncbi:T9SS type A sorting domain-containing protein [Yeosuana marina]|uniref:T9SS type A sorting domain-containing protein n=1 Tax=Yeosuana marina TaxID=1565536 RepID=UPI0030EC18C7|tara:strand:- start:524 stop:2536 length:2013 start_codon:yes stop_codon:yes gene_type:complete
MKQKYFILWCLSLIVPTISMSQGAIPPGNLGVQIINTGTLKIESSTVVYFGGAYLNSEPGTHDNEGDLYLNSDFINDGSTSSFSGTTFFTSSVNDTLSISGTAGSINFYNLEVNVTSSSKKGVSVADGFGLIVENGVNLVSGDLRLVGEAQLIQTHTTGTNLNTSSGGSLLRDQQGISNTFGYNYWSSPVTNNLEAFTLSGGLFDGTDADINSFEPEQVGFNTGSPYNGIPAGVDVDGMVITPLEISDRWLYTYSPNTSGYSGWDKIDETSSINPGIGFTMKGTAASPNQNYVFKGVPNDGEYTFSINAGESVLLGNPYPSALDAEKFINDNLGVIDQIEFWVDGGSNSHYLSNYLGGYAIQNLTATTLPSVISSIAGLGSTAGIIPKQYVAVGQGFFVEAINDGPIDFNNSQRIFEKEDTGNSIFYKTSGTKSKAALEEEPKRFIRIGYEDPEMFHRQIVLGFLPNCPASLDFNLGYDAVMFDPREDELFYIIEHDLTRKYVIQGVGAYNSSYEFPIGIKISQEGTHTIMIDAVENFEDVIYIKDNVLNISYNLTESNFSPNLPPGEYLDRFSIVFSDITSKSTLDTEDVFADNNLRVHYLNNKIVINNNSNLELSDVSIFNTVGQKITEVNKNDLKQQEITIPFMYQQGMYVVKIESGQRNKTFKIIN